MPILKLLPMLLKVFLARNVEIDYKSKYPDKEKPKILRQRTMGKVFALLGVVTAGGTLVSGEEITPESIKLHITVLIDAGIGMYNIATQPEVGIAFMFLWGVVLWIKGEKFKEKRILTTNVSGNLVVKELKK